MAGSASPDARMASRSPSRSPARSRSRTPASDYSRRSGGKRGSPSRSQSRSPDVKRRRRSPSPAMEAPFLIKVYVKQGPGFHDVLDFEDQVYPTKDEYAVWAWKSSTLQQVTSLLLPTLPLLLRSPLARYTYRLLFVDAPPDIQMLAPADRKGRRVWRTKEMGGAVFGRDLISDSDKFNRRSLDDLRFQSGDHLMLSITLPNQSGPPGPPNPLLAGGAGAPPPRLSGVNAIGPGGGRMGAGAGGAGGSAFSVFGASVRNGRPQGQDLLAGQVGAPESGSWKDAKESNPPPRGYGSRDDRWEGRRSSWKEREGPSGGKPRDERPRYFEKSELLDAGRGGSTDAAPKRSGRDRSESPARRRSGARRASPEYR